VDGQPPVAAAEVHDAPPLDEPDEPVAEGLPGLSGRGHVLHRLGIEELARLVAALLQHLLEVALIARMPLRGHRALQGGMEDGELGVVTRGAVPLGTGDAVEDLLPLLAAGHQVLLLEQAQLGGEGALAQAQDLLQFPHRQLVGLQQGQDAQARLIAEKLENPRQNVDMKQLFHSLRPLYRYIVK
jgi:hypothetical protein